MWCYIRIYSWLILMFFAYCLMGSATRRFNSAILYASRSFSRGQRTLSLLGHASANWSPSSAGGGDITLRNAGSVRGGGGSVRASRGAAGAAAATPSAVKSPDPAAAPASPPKLDLRLRMGRRELLYLYLTGYKRPLPGSPDLDKSGI